MSSRSRPETRDYRISPAWFQIQTALMKNSKIPTDLALDAVLRDLDAEFRSPSSRNQVQVESQ